MSCRFSSLDSGHFSADLQSLTVPLPDDAATGGHFVNGKFASGCDVLDPRLTVEVGCCNCLGNGDILPSFKDDFRGEGRRL